MSDGYSDDDDEDLFAFNPDAAPAPKKRRKEIDVSLLKTSDTSLEAAAAEREASEAAVSWVAAALALRWHEVLRHPWVAGQALGDWIAAHWAWA